MQDIAEQGEAPRGFYAEIAFDSVGPRLGDIDQPREGGEDRIDIIARNLLVAIIIIEGADANLDIVEIGAQAAFERSQLFLLHRRVLRRGAVGVQRVDARFIPPRSGSLGPQYVARTESPEESTVGKRCGRTRIFR